MRYAVPSWSTWFHPLFQRDEAAKKAVEALKLFADLVKIPKDATWRAFPRQAGVFVTAEWGQEDHWMGNLCLICGGIGPFNEHVHSYCWHTREKGEDDKKTGP